MPKDNPTFEEVNKHIEKADLKKMEKSSGGALAAADAAIPIPAQICANYQIIRPILALIASAFFLPDKWRKAVKAFMKFMDTLCP
jgi:hypothetical protein